MALLIFAIVVVIVAGLLVWAVDSVPLPNPLGVVIKVVIILFAALVIASRAGLF